LIKDNEFDYSFFNAWEEYLRTKYLLYVTRRNTFSELVKNDSTSLCRLNNSQNKRSNTFLSNTFLLNTFLSNAFLSNMTLGRITHYVERDTMSNMTLLLIILQNFLKNKYLFSENNSFKLNAIIKMVVRAFK
jgi:hypothetical protein